jgi:hypothetical protein
VCIAGAAAATITMGKDAARPAMPPVAAPLHRAPAESAHEPTPCSGGAAGGCAHMYQASPRDGDGGGMTTLCSGGGYVPRMA